ncbi:MAG: hypothetical protein J0I06_12295 [Planctomycetes bacterium]|nr:hypothetical protein [Planctomycetota bacterium]
MTIDLAQTFGTRLQGRLNGRRDFARLCELASTAAQGEVVHLDFTGVELVTGSWLNEALVPLLRWAADERNDLYPVLQGLGDTVRDELVFVASATNTHFLALSRHSPPRAVLIGSLDPGQRATLEALMKYPDVTGAELERREPGGEKVRATAWNNRLKDLFEKRLLRRVKRGREHLYSPVVPEVVLNG